MHGRAAGTAPALTLSLWFRSSSIACSNRTLSQFSAQLQKKSVSVRVTSEKFEPWETQRLRVPPPPLGPASAPPTERHRQRCDTEALGAQPRRQTAPVVLNSAIASAVTPANPVAAVHTARAPLSSAAAATHRYRVQTPQGRTKTSRGRANSSRTRQMPRSCLIRQLPAPSHLRIQRQLCTHHTPHRAALPHSCIAITHKHHNHARKQAVAQQTLHACGNSSGCA